MQEMIVLLGCNWESRLLLPCHAACHGFESCLHYDVPALCQPTSPFQSVAAAQACEWLSAGADDLLAIAINLAESLQNLQRQQLEIAAFKPQSSCLNPF